MALKTTVFTQMIKKDGYFNYNDMYSFCLSWFSGEGYTPVEANYTEKEKDGKEILVLWAPYRKVTDYFKFVINVEVFIRHMVSTEVERDGKKEKTNKGTMRIKVRSEIVKDYEERWEQRPMSKFLRGIYEQYIIRTTIDEYEERLKTDSRNFSNELKAFLELSS